MTELRRFSRFGEKKAGVHNKFYEVEAEEHEDGSATWYFRWGRIGTAGTEKKGRALSFEGAKSICLDQWGKKRNRGYTQVNAMEALASAVQDVSERRTNGLEPVEIEPPVFHADRSEQRCQEFCRKYLNKLNVIRKDRYTLSYMDYERQINALLKSYCKEWARILKTKAHGHLRDNAPALSAMRIFFGDLIDNAKCNVSGYFEGVGVC